MAKKRTAKKVKIKRKLTTKKNKSKKRPARNPDIRVVAEEARMSRANDVFEGINGRRPKSHQELKEWLASPEGKAAMMYELTSASRWGETGRS